MNIMTAERSDLSDALTFSGTPIFSVLERNALSLGAFDPPSSLKPPREGKLSAVFAFLFGAPHRYTLADPRLEALRRVAVLAHVGRSIAGNERSAFFAAGYSQTQLQIIVENAAFERNDRKGKWS